MLVLELELELGTDAKPINPVPAYDHGTSEAGGRCRAPGTDFTLCSFVLESLVVSVEVGRSPNLSPLDSHKARIVLSQAVSTAFFKNVLPVIRPTSVLRMPPLMPSGPSQSRPSYGEGTSLQFVA